MKCLLCDLQNYNNEELKNHPIHFHLIDKDNYFFKELFTKDVEISTRDGVNNLKKFSATVEKKSLFFITLLSVWRDEQ